MRNDSDEKNDDMSGPIEQELLMKVGESIQARAENIDAETAAKLDQIRIKAMESISQPAPSWSMQVVYGGAFAACLVVAFVMLNLSPDRLEPELPYFETVLLNSDFEMLSEDLEFYEWLEQEVEDDV